MFKKHAVIFIYTYFIKFFDIANFMFLIVLKHTHYGIKNFHIYKKFKVYFRYE